MFCAHRLNNKKKLINNANKLNLNYLTKPLFVIIFMTKHILVVLKF